MGLHEEFLELCAAATANELTAEEQAKLNAHLKECPECRRAMEEYESIATHGAPHLAAQLSQAEDSGDESWSVEPAEKRFPNCLDQEGLASDEAAKSTNSPANIGKRYGYRPSRIRWKEVWMPFAAAILLAAALGVTLYKTGLRRGVESARFISTPSNGVGAVPGAPVGADTQEPVRLEAMLAERNKTIEELKRELADQKKAIFALQSASEKVADGRDLLKSEAAKSKQAELAAAQARLTDLQKELDAATSERSEINNRAAALEQRVAELSRLDKQREHAIDEKDVQIANLEELLEHDRDIRDLMGARDLYMADVHDVGGKGTEKTYGRVFYTKGKSLIFYAFDLDARPGVRNASAFQAWGRRGPDKQQARSLGIFYEDNASKKRWVLKADDPKTLEDIDAVFVTLEPNGGSQHPSGKQLLFAWLRVEPNHP